MPELGVGYFVRRSYEIEGPNKVVDKDWSDDALGIVILAIPSQDFGKVDRDRFVGALDVSIGDVDATIEDAVQGVGIERDRFDGASDVSIGDVGATIEDAVQGVGMEYSVMAEDVETADALHRVE